MKFSPSVLLLLLVFDGLEGLILPQERPDKGHNTTLLANFSGLYVRRNPCSNEKVESSFYEASHELHHYNRGANWTDYTCKCSTLISNFLKSICNLMKFNNKPDGTFTFHVNSTISQKQADQHNCKDQKYSLPTIIIKATNHVNSEQHKKPQEKGLTKEGPKQEVGSDLIKSQKSPRNLKKTSEELSAISQRTSTSGTLREETEVDLPVTEIPEGFVETLPLDDNPFFILTTVSPTSTSEKQEIVEEITEFSEKSEGLNAGNVLQIPPFNNNIGPNVEPIQPVESSDYLTKRAEFNIPEVIDGTTGLPEYLPTTDHFQPEKVPAVLLTKNQPPMLKQSDVIQYAPLTNAASSGRSSVDFGPQTHFGVTQPNRKNSFGQGSDYPVSEKIDGELPDSHRKIPQPDQNPSYTPGVLNLDQETTPLQVAESLIKSNRKTPLGTTMQGPLPLAAAQYEEKVIDQVQSSDQSDSTYSQIYETTLANNQNFPKHPVHGKMENISPRNQLPPKTVLDEGITQPLDYLPTTSLPMFASNGKRTTENLTFKPERQDAEQFANFSEQTKSFKSSKNRPPVTEPITDAASVTYSPAKTQDNRFVSESSLTSDTVKYDLSDSLSSSSSTFLPPSSVSGTSQIPEPRTDYYDIEVEQPASNVNNANAPTISYSEPNPEMTTTVYESSISYFPVQNQQSNEPSTGAFGSQTTPSPRPLDLIIPVETQYNEENMLTSAAKTTFSNHGTNYGKNFDSFTTYHPTTLPFEPESETELGNGNLKPKKPSANKLPEKIKASTKLESTTSPSLRKPLRAFKNIADRNRFPIVTQPQSRTTEQFSDTTLDSSDDYSQQSSSTLVPSSVSREFAPDRAYNAGQDPLLTVNSQNEDPFAFEESYTLNQNDAETFSEQREYDDIVSSQDARTQIPQPKPSFDYSDYSGQLSSNEREANAGSTNLQTSKTFHGPDANVEPLLTFSPLPSVPSKTETFTTETYEIDEMTDDYPLPSELELKPVTSSALERTETSPPSLSQSSPDRSTETIDITELSEVYSTPTYNSQLISVTPPPSATIIEEPPSVETNLPARETFGVPETFIQDVATTPRPKYKNSVTYDQEIITIDSQPTPSPSPVSLLPVSYSDRFLNKENEQDFVGSSNLEVIQQTENRLERSDSKETASQTVVKNSNRNLKNERIVQESNLNKDVAASHTALIQKKYDAPLLNKGANNFLKTETNHNNFGLTTSTVRPAHAVTTIDEEVITTDDSNSLTLSSTKAPPVSYSQKLNNEQFDGQRHHFPSTATPRHSKHFHPENWPTYHPPQGFPSHHQFDHRPYGGTYPQPLNFNPHNPRPWPNHFDNFAREQHNQFPAGFQHNQFEPHYPAPGRFQPRSDAQRDRFTFPGQPSNYGNGYFPYERPESQVPPYFYPFQHPNVFQEKDPQYQSYLAEGRTGEEDFNSQPSAPQYPQNYDPYSYYPRNDFIERFGPNHQSFGPESRDRFHPDQIPYNRMNQMMPATYGNRSPGHLNFRGPPFLNNSNQQIEDRHRQYNFDHHAYSVKEAKTEEARRTDQNQASAEVLADYKKALTGLASGEKLVEFDEEVITISPEKGPSSERTAAIEERGQRQDAASYSSRNHDGQSTGSLLKVNSTDASGQMLERPVPQHQAQQGNPVFRTQNSHGGFHFPSSSSFQSHQSPFSRPVDSFGPRRMPPPPNFSDRFRGASSDFRHPSSADFVNARKEVGSNPSQSDSYALGHDQIFPSRKPGRRRRSQHLG